MNEIIDEHMNKAQINQIIFIIAALLTITGAITYLMNFVYAPYVFTVGSVLLIYCHVQVVLSAKDENFRAKRLGRIGLMSSLMLLIGDYFMFLGSNSWVVFLLIYALISLFLSFRTE